MARGLQWLDDMKTNTAANVTDTVTSEYVRRVDRTVARARLLKASLEAVARLEAMEAEGYIVDRELKIERARVAAFT